MSETVLRILLSEIKTLRITCKNCKAVIETLPDDLYNKTNNGQCKFCNQPLASISHIFDLARAIENLSKTEDTVTVEIVLPVKD